MERSGTDQRRIIFLDGARGWAALVVVLSHTFQQFLLNQRIVAAHGAPSFWAWMNSTPIGNLFDGTEAVFVFFLISGVALSLPVLKSGRPLQTLANMAGVRYFRLTIPVFCSCLVMYVLWEAGVLYLKPASASAQSDWLGSFLHFAPTFAGMLRYSLAGVYSPNFDAGQSWNAVLWTMPIELIGSFGLFAAMAAIRNANVRWVCALIGSFLLINSYFFGFAAGYLFASGMIRRNDVNKPAMAIGCFIAAMFLLIVLRSPLWVWIPSWLGITAYRNIIALLIMLSFWLSAAFRTALSSQVSKFMGKISFPLYLIQLPVIFSFGSWFYLQTEAAFPFWFGSIFAGSVIVAVSIFAAILFRSITDPIIDTVKNWITRLLTLSAPLAIDRTESAHRTGRKAGQRA